MGTEEFDTGQPHSARVYDYLLGGKDNFAADRAAAEMALGKLPTLRASVQANRSFMIRSARYLAAERGLRQFLDIGTGLPTAPNLHQVVQAVDPTCRVVYVDNDPIVLVHARALLTSAPEGRTAYVEADLRTPKAITDTPALRDTLDLDRPVAVSLIAVMHFVTDDDATRQILSALIDPLAPGSALALSVVTTDADPDAAPAGFESLRTNVTAVRPRTLAEVEAMFDGLELVEPGVVPVHQWRPDSNAPRLLDTQVHVYGAVGIKP
ncbi:MAG TPA: SAM-dependent methyltransferase [Kineosporiaceae bacterium]|nr:SAM-dependent methyltransferase [Kineosporiaceae bacterium]